MSVQIGDVIALSQLAWRLGKMFTTERKNAPAKFSEVEDQFYSLSIVLKILAENKALAETIEKDNRLGRMIINCETSLKGLEEFLQEYSDVITPKSRRLQDKFVQEWKKLKWTQKGGDLDALKENIKTHYQALGGILSVIGATRMEEISSKVGEMYDWWVKCLQKPAKISSSPGGQEPLVCISEKSARGDGDDLLCPRAQIRVECLEEEELIGSRLFDCACNSNDHYVNVESLTILSKSVLVKSIKDKPTWMLFVHSSTKGREVELTLTACSVFSMNKLEEFISRFAFRQGMASTLYSDSLWAHRSTSSTGEEVLCVIKAQSNVSHIEDQIKGFNFRSTETGGQYFAGAIDSVHLVQYFFFSCPQTETDGVDSRCAELIFFEEADTFESRPLRQFTVRVQYDTDVGLGSNSATVIMSDVCCIQESEAGGTTTQADVEVGVKSSDAGQDLLDTIRLMQAELWISYLRGCRNGEVAESKGPAPESVFGKHHLVEPSVSEVFDTISKRKRLVVSNKAGSLHACIEPATGSSDAQIFEIHVVLMGPDRIIIDKVESSAPMRAPADWDMNFLV
ncbi:uncharacterized protein J3D65DRAFT_633171 [Phyllosticta citribraziliensis]|uniref:Uncharacterized protein n=1 Tax=Phyllosticta citribraziliensis TaxID=989973 RepID=A0ABR1LIJ5_9PEZI